MFRYVSLIWKEQRKAISEPCCALGQIGESVRDL